ncbi:DUF547 domain-containing protein [Methylophaga sp. OBS4]|uniref:DUF547 domain-containing protein n=1 Tax=Methylophaga sp. OBS4 TaxID=2991935 RepID=UPI00225B4F28|nr:DUF547 domain-containing protein [Methylophaga sp. OBS4]MCX4186521.1 DUF547 domain-containing protein [Methylophaga sp. OBS4]
MMRLILFLAGMLMVNQIYAADFDHGIWDKLLRNHVVVLDDGKATQVDYGGFSNERSRLKLYLNQLAAVEATQFEKWPAEAQLAFLINAYNAWTVELILTAYPDLESIRDLGSVLRSPWKKTFIPLLGEEVSLDHIEHDMIRGSGRFEEPRIHFAVNCASVGCPALRAEAYSAERLNEQLEQQTRLFLADASRNRLETGRLAVSQIFKWYREDFEQGWRGRESLASFLAIYADALDLSAAQQAALQTGALEIEFLDYDWRLNDKS